MMLDSEMPEVAHTPHVFVWKVLESACKASLPRSIWWYWSRRPADLGWLAVEPEPRRGAWQMNRGLG